MEYKKELVETKEKSFAYGLNVYKIFWIFFIGCIAGVIVELIWCFYKHGYIESRTALVLSPLNPIYGIGAVLVTLLFCRCKNNILIFIGSMITGGVFEFLCSFAQEKAFGTVSWWYSGNSLGIFGRTSLVYCLYWGVLGILYVKYIYPFLSERIEKIPNKYGKILTICLASFILFDMCFSTLVAVRHTERKQNIEPKNGFEEFIDTRYNDEVFKKIYPNLTFKE